MSFRKIWDWLSNIFYFKTNSFSLTTYDLTSSIYMWYLTFNTLTFVCSKFSLHRFSIFRKGSYSSSNSKVINGTDFRSRQGCDTRNNTHKSRQSEKFSMVLDKVLVCKKDGIGIKKRPNYFVAVQITNDEVHSSVKQIQEHILLKNVLLEKFMISRNTLHVTLMVLHLQDSDDHSKAIEALKTAQQEYNNSFNKEPLKLEFCGVDHFQNRVIFAKIKKNESYHRLSDLVKSINSHLERIGLQNTDVKKEFTPHLTIAKVKSRKHFQQKYKKILPSSYQDFIDLHFGYDIVKSIQLLKMQGPKTSLGYYSGDELLFDSNDQVLLKKLNSVYSIAEKKITIKNKVSNITKKLSLYS